MIACPFCSCFCCRWPSCSARRAVSNNPRPGFARGFFYALITAGRPKSPREPPGAPLNLAPVRMYARHPLAPSAPVLARRGYACAVPAIPAECAAPLTMPLQGAVSGFYIPHTSDRVNAFPRVLRPSGAPCNVARGVPSRRLRERPAEGLPYRPKRTRPEAGHISAAFPSGFSIRFSSRFFRLAISPYASHSRRHSRLP